MTLYEIDAAMDALVDQETGEILDAEVFDALEMERDRKIENVACCAKNEAAMADALGAEIRKLQERKKAAENRVKRLKDYLLYATGGEKFRSARAQVSFRQTESVAITNEDELVTWAMMSDAYDDILKYAPPEISKSAVKNLLKDGIEIPGAQIVSSVSVSIK